MDYAVSTESDSDRVSIGVSIEFKVRPTRSLSLSVLTSSVTQGTVWMCYDFFLSHDFSQGASGFAGAGGILNFESSTGTFSLISEYLRVETRPGSTEDTLTVNGSFTPSTSR